MKKILLLGVLASSAVAFAEDVNISSDTSFIAQDNTTYTITADDIVMSNSAALRHLTSSTVFDIGGHTGIVYTNPTEPAGAKFGFNGVIFKGNGGSLTVGNYTDRTGSEVVSKEILIIQGFTVDGITLNFNMPTNTSFNTAYTHTITVQNNGVLNWNSVNPADYRLKFDVKQGSELNATFATKGYFVGGTFAGKFSIGSADNNPSNFTLINSTISNQTAAKQSFLYNKLRIHGSLVVSNSEAGSVKMNRDEMVLTNSAKMTLDSSNVFTYGTSGQKAMKLLVDTGAVASLVLNADNDFAKLGTLNDASVVNITLNGSKLNLGEIANAGKIFFEDFQENLVKVDAIDSSLLEADGSVKNVFAGVSSDEASAKQLYWNKDTGFLSVSAIPEPATYAALLGGLAILLAFVKRRR